MQQATALRHGDQRPGNFVSTGFVETNFASNVDLGQRYKGLGGAFSSGRLCVAPSKPAIHDFRIIYIMELFDVGKC
jgi:hypothetical protein